MVVLMIANTTANSGLRSRSRRVIGARIGHVRRAEIASPCAPRDPGVQN